MPRIVLMAIFAGISASIGLIPSCSGQDRVSEPDLHGSNRPFVSHSPVRETITVIAPTEESAEPPLSDEFLQSYALYAPVPHSCAGCWCTAHDQCHRADYPPPRWDVLRIPPFLPVAKCNWTPECRPKLPFLASIWKWHDNVPRAQIVGTDGGVRLVKAGEQSVEGFTILDFGERSVVILLSDLQADIESVLIQYVIQTGTTIDPLTYRNTDSGDVSKKSTL
jgi:hypothetical protein